MAESEYDTKMQTIEFNIEDSELEELKEAARFLKVPLSEIYDRMLTEYISNCYGLEYVPGKDPRADRLLQKINASSYEYELNERKQEKMLKQMKANRKNGKNVIQFPTMK